ncbi:hypothetical protein [Pseudonocardia aurantiaca]|uniref:DUF4440 domain-containing protein n=1 Tax=Pseudonocardia aurantiaca TaxID=75290 RepID=A0ABW4FRH9_9PSEU
MTVDVRAAVAAERREQAELLAGFTPALLVVDWSLRGTAPDGTSVDMSGTAADVVRRDPDGTWRYLVDNPFGTT